MDSELSRAVNEYNKLVDEWNERYGDRCAAMRVDKTNIRRSRLKRLRTLFSNEWSEKKKVSVTKTVVGDFENTEYRGTDELTRGELARLIVQKGEAVLKRI